MAYLYRTQTRAAPGPSSRGGSQMDEQSVIHHSIRSSAISAPTRAQLNQSILARIPSEARWALSAMIRGMHTLQASIGSLIAIDRTGLLAWQ